MKDPVVHEVLRQIQDLVREDLGRDPAPGTTERIGEILTSALGRWGPGRRENLLSHDVTLLLADLRGFTSIAATYPAGTVLDLLNKCFVRMSEIIFRHHGTIDKFLGDSILVLFEGDDEAEPVRHAIACAVDMQLAMDAANRAQREHGMPELYFGIGINTGRVMSALLGSDLYSEHTVIGDEVKLASRIESFSLRGQVLISQSTYERCRDFAFTGEPLEVVVKGKTRPVVLREVLSIPSLGKVVPRQEVRRSPRVNVKIPFTYRLVENQAVAPEPFVGRILDIGYHGVLAEVSDEVAPFTELRLEFDLPLVGDRLVDLYGKVVTVTRKSGQCRVGIEFAAVSARHRSSIQLFVQLLIQGSESRD